MLHTPHEAPEPADSPDGCPGAGPRSGSNVTIFRRQAVERYVRRGGEQVVPRLATPRELLWLWLLVAVLAGGALATGWSLGSRTAPAAETAAEGGR